MKWVTETNLTKVQYEELRNNTVGPGRCNTAKDKTYSCYSKVNTRGIEAEGLRQVGLFYLDLVESYKSKSKFLKNNHFKYQI